MSARTIFVLGMMFAFAFSHPTYGDPTDPNGDGQATQGSQSTGRADNPPQELCEDDIDNNGNGATDESPCYSPVAPSTSAGATKETTMEAVDPVNMATGEYSFTMELLDLGGLMPLSVALYYGSQEVDKQIVDGLPSRFILNSTGRLSYNELVTGAREPVVIKLGLGEEAILQRHAAVWNEWGAANHERVRYQMKETADSYYLMDPEAEIVYTFVKQPSRFDYYVRDSASQSPDGAPANQSTQAPAISDDGRYVAFTSDASNLVANDTNTNADVFVRDRLTGATTRVSVDSAGTQALFGSTSSPSLSADGRYVAFAGSAMNLVENDTNLVRDIFVHDRTTGQTVRVSVSTSGAQANGASALPNISADGRYIAFQSAATNLVANDTNGREDIFVHDRETGLTARVSLGADGVEANDASGKATISSDGRYVAFFSRAYNLAANEIFGLPEIYVHDRFMGTTELISVNSAEEQANAESFDSSISDDGRFVAFQTAATNLGGDDPFHSDIFVRDRLAGTTTKISVSSQGESGNSSSIEPRISRNGRYVVFRSFASNLDDEFDGNNEVDIFVHDRQTGQTERASVGVLGVESTDIPTGPAISADGRYVAFTNGAQPPFFETEVADQVFISVRSGEDGVLVRQEDRNGNALTYENAASPSQTGPTRITDNFGRELNFTYSVVATQDTRPYLTQVTDHGGRSILFAYEANPTDNPDGVVLRSITDPGGRQTRFNYGGHQLITQKIMPRGNIPYTQTYTFDLAIGGGIVQTQTDALGNVWTFTKGNTGTPGQTQFTMTNPDQTQRVFRHGRGGRVKEALTDEAGKTIQVQSGTAAEAVTGYTDRRGDTTSVTYHASGKLASYTNVQGNTMSNTFTAQDQTFANPINDEAVTFTFYDLTRFTYFDGSFETFTYDDKGNRLSSTDRAGKTTTYAYNNRGQVLSITNPAGGATTYTFNPDATLASRIDSDTATTQFGYDLYKRLSNITNPDATTLQLTYDLNDRIISLTDEDGNIFTNTYDANGNLATRTDPAGRTIRYAYDSMDRQIQRTDRLDKTSTFSYDMMGRLAAVSTANGVTTAFGYDLAGRPNRATIGTQTVRTEYDEEGIITAHITPLGHRTSFQTNSLGQVIRVVDSLGGETALDRDALGRPTSLTNALSRTSAYAYDDLGNRIAVTTPTVGSSSYVRNELGLITQVADPNGNDWTFGYTAMGRLQSVTDPRGNAVQYTLDSSGRPSAIAFADNSTLAISYDNRGNITRNLYSDGTDIQYTHDVLNTVIGANDVTLTRDAETRITGTVHQGVLFGAARDDDGKIETATYNNGAITVTYSYDATTGLLRTVSDDLTSAQIEFAYDADFRLVGITRDNGVNTTIAYDPESRPIRIQHGSIIDLQFSTDAVGQIVGIRMVAPVEPGDYLNSGSDVFAYDAASQVMGYTYDARGRLTATPQRIFTWDDRSRLTRIDPTAGSDASVVLAYNGLDDLAVRTEGPTTIRYYYNRSLGFGPMVAEQDGASNQFLRYYVWTPDGRLLYMIDAADGNNVYYYHFDQIGSTLALTNASGIVTDAYAYTPYGKLLRHEGTSRQPFTFVGQSGIRQEGSSGSLYQMRSRYYDAVAGRFLTRDPIWPRLTDAPSINPYSYAARNPISFIDPDGRVEIPPWNFDRSFGYAYNLKTIAEGSGKGSDDVRKWLDALNERLAYQNELIADFEAGEYFTYQELADRWNAENFLGRQDRTGEEIRKWQEEERQDVIEDIALFEEVLSIALREEAAMEKFGLARAEAEEKIKLGLNLVQFRELQAQKQAKKEAEAARQRAEAAQWAEERAERDKEEAFREQLRDAQVRRLLRWMATGYDFGHQ